MRIALASYTSAGRALGERIREARPQDDFSLFDKTRDKLEYWTKAEFERARALIFIGAAGIAVRHVAPLLRGKDRDPAVLVIDEKGRYVIPILSGHIGGANRMAGEIAAALGAEAVITTSTDVNGVFAADEWAVMSGCAVANVNRIKDISSRLLEGKTVGFHSDFPVAGQLPAGLEKNADFEAGVCVSHDAGKSPFPLTLNIVPKIAVLGVGCKKGAGPEEFEAFVLETLARHNISPKALACLASIDLKEGEECFCAFAEKYGIKFSTFNADELERVPGNFSASEFVKEVTGVDNVCERSALAGGGKKLLIHKTGRNGMTLALAVQDWICRF